MQSSVDELVVTGGEKICLSSVQGPIKFLNDSMVNATPYSQWSQWEITGFSETRLMPIKFVCLRYRDHLFKVLNNGKIKPTHHRYVEGNRKNRYRNCRNQCSGH